jgi:hypothetical protein
MDLLLSRPLVIGLAILGAVVSTLAAVLQARNKIDATRATQLNRAGYVAMGVSMLLFILAGFRA